MKFKINSTGNVILAEQAFMDAVHPGDYTRLPGDEAPVAVTPWTKKDFLTKFTPTEYAAIKTAAALNHDLDYYWTLFNVAEEVLKTDPLTIAGINLLEQAGLIATGRAAQILG